MEGVIAALLLIEALAWVVVVYRTKAFAPLPWWRRIVTVAMFAAIVTILIMLFVQFSTNANVTLWIVIIYVLFHICVAGRKAYHANAAHPHGSDHAPARHRKDH